MKKLSPSPLANLVRSFAAACTLLSLLPATLLAQDTKADKEAEPPVLAAQPIQPDPCLPALGVSQTTICQGGTAVLTVNTGCYNAGPYTYTWSPNQDISSTNNYRVVVNPLFNTTYTVTATSPNGPTLTFSTTINVQTNCCQQSMARGIVELNSVYYLYNGSLPGQPLNDPFRLYPPGTTFHVTGSLYLYGNANQDYFRMPAGSVLLIDPEESIYLGQDAMLEMNGSTITTACEDMWGGLFVKGNSDLLDLHAVPLNATSGGMHNRIMHSVQGIVLEDQGPEFQINYTQFLHNYSSLSIDRSNPPSQPHYYTSSVPINKVSYCSFDSDPYQMKAPYNASGSDYWYSQYHVRIKGDLRSSTGVGQTPGTFTFNDNTLNNCAIGVLADRSRTPLNPIRCTFNNFLLAGIYYGNPTGTLTAVTSNDALTLNGAYPCTFNFRPYSALPATTQMSSVQSTYGMGYGTTGIRARDIRVNVDGTTFTQASPGNYGLFGPTPGQVGIEATDLNLNGSTFNDLAFGVVHDLLAVGTGGGAQTAKQNLFAGCGTGYLFTAGGGSTNSSNAGTAFLDCNTFARVTANSINSGPYAYNGIGVEGNAFAKIADPSNVVSAAILKNRFDDGGLGAARFQAIYNAGVNVVEYNTFDNYWSSVVQPLSYYVALPVNRVAGSYTGGSMNCAPTGPNGLPRATVVTPVQLAVIDPLEQNVPNPAQGATSITYQVPRGTNEAKLLVRRALDGGLVQTLPLDAKATKHELNLATYPAGTYFYTLVVDGMPLATRRLVVQ